MRSLLRALVTAFALLGAALALAVAAMAVLSIAGRALWARPIPGDVELTQFGIGCAIALSLPWCQWRGANIIVDFFTQRLSSRGRGWLDAAGALAIALMCTLLGWRSGVAALAVREAGETSMILALPMWWLYAALVPGLGLTAMVALAQALDLARGRAPAGVQRST